MLMPLVETHAETPWQARFAQRMGCERLGHPGAAEAHERPILSFAGAAAPEVFPLAEVDAAVHRVLTMHGRAALQYSTTEGYPPLRELLVRHMGRYGIQVTPDNVLITSGSQQALDLIGKLLLNPGDRVLTEEPTFLGAIQAFAAYQAEFVTVPIDDDGLRVDLLEEALRSGPKFMYVLPNFQNPGGVTLSLERRRRLVELASRYGTPIVEDDPYGQLRYEGHHLPPLVKVDAEYHGCANGERAFRGGVLYLGTMSKTLAPGLRLGWVVAPLEVIQKLVQLKQGTDLHTSTLTQMVAYEVARGGFLDRHVRVIRKVYGDRRDAMLRALKAHFPPSVRWTHPKGGLFLWVTLPPGLDSAELLDEALRQQVAFVPGGPFFPRGGGAACAPQLLLLQPQKIEGDRRLGGAASPRSDPARFSAGA
jgi:2-aminoadipate transaminase